MPREELKWELHKEIKHESGITLRVNILSLRRPVYSFEVGVLKDGGYLNRFFPGGLPWETDFAGIISELVEEACQYIDDTTLKESEESAKSEQEKFEQEKDKRDKRAKNLESRKAKGKKKN
jgi:hypothetical protein